MVSSSRWIPLLSILCGFLPPGVTIAADVARATDLDEVTVIGEKLRQIQAELLDVQQRFLTRYNETNTRNDFDIHCSYRPATGTTLRKRDCRVAFVLEATAQQGRDFLESFTTESSRPPTPPAHFVWMERREEFRENFRQQLRENPELRQLMLEWQQLQTRYDTTRKDRLKGRLVLFE